MTAYVLVLFFDILAHFSVLHFERIHFATGFSGVLAARLLDFTGPFQRRT
jgi:hypothetical protein